MSLLLGGIAIWSGSTLDIPEKWQLCDGTNGTPDLRNRFVVGAGSTYSVGATGGFTDSIVVSHTHTGTTNSTGGHSHTFQQSAQRGGRARPFSNWDTVATNENWPTTSAGLHTHDLNINSSGSSGVNANLPPYYALCYIQQIEE